MQERDQNLRDVASQGQGSSSSAHTPPYNSDLSAINGSPTSDRSSHSSATTKSTTHIVPLHSSGRILSTEGQAGYVGPEHWKTILESIAEVREFLDDSPDISPDIMEIVPRTEEPYLLMPHIQTFDREEILSSIPDKPDCDQLVYRYVNTVGPTRGMSPSPLCGWRPRRADLVVVMIHGPTFSAEVCML